MSKEFIKIGPINCSIQADPPYKNMRNGKRKARITFRHAP